VKDILNKFCWWKGPWTSAGK